jgi:hypothetical protein
MTPELVAQVVAVVFLAQGREAPDGVTGAWWRIFDDLADGSDVLEVTSRVVRATAYITAGDIHRAIVAERRRQALRRALPAATDGDGAPLVCRKCGGTGWLDLPSHDRRGYRYVAKCPCDDLQPERLASKETARFWATKCREQLDKAKGPLATGLKPIVTVPRADQAYFADRHDSDPVEQWWGDDPPEEPTKGEL